VTNRAPDTAILHVLPTLWFRNTWSWGTEQSPKPTLHEAFGIEDVRVIAASHAELGDRWLYIEGDQPILFGLCRTRIRGTPVRIASRPTTPLE
jgi:hypothetical protein